MSENSCRSKRKGKSKVKAGTLLREESQDQDMETGGREGRYHSYTETQLRSLLDASFPNPAASFQLLAQMPALLIPSTSCGEEGDEGVGNDGTLCLQVPGPGELLTQPALKFQPVRGSGGQGAGRGTIVPFTTPPDTLPLPGSSHEVATLGSILVHLAFIPIPPVWPSCQLSGSLQSPA